MILIRRQLSKSILQKKVLSCLILAVTATLSLPATTCAKTNQQSTYKVTRTYNYNWQANILNKYPSARHFNWTPMILTTAKRIDRRTGGKSVNQFHYLKPVVIASQRNSIKNNNNNNTQPSSSVSCSYASQYQENVVCATYKNSGYSNNQVGGKIISSAQAHQSLVSAKIAYPK